MHPVFSAPGGRGSRYPLDWRVVRGCTLQRACSAHRCGGRSAAAGAPFGALPAERRGSFFCSMLGWATRAIAAASARSRCWGRTGGSRAQPRSRVALGHRRADSVRLPRSLRQPMRHKHPPHMSRQPSYPASCTMTPASGAQCSNLDLHGSGTSHPCSCMRPSALQSGPPFFHVPTLEAARH